LDDEITHPDLSLEKKACVSAMDDEERNQKEMEKDKP
jgi:hypothetical protein